MYGSFQAFDQSDYWKLIRLVAEWTISRITDHQTPGSTEIQ